MSSPTPDPNKPIFRRDGDALVPTELARGPWHEGAQHGSAVMGLLARAIEAQPIGYPAQTTRLTVDMMRAAPRGPVTTAVNVIKEGNAIQLLAASFEVNGEVVARASAIRTRTEAIDVEASAPAPRHTAAPLPAERRTLPGRELDGEGEYFHHALELRGALDAERPAVWIRIVNPLVDDEPLTPFVRAAMSADWAYSVPTLHGIFAGTYAGEGQVVTINPDTNLHLHRPMTGEWLYLDSHVHLGPIGAGSAMAELHDHAGPVGHASQAIVIKPVARR